MWLWCVHLTLVLMDHHHHQQLPMMNCPTCVLSRSHNGSNYAFHWKIHSQKWHFSKYRRWSCSWQQCNLPIFPLCKNSVSYIIICGGFCMARTDLVSKRTVPFLILYKFLFEMPVQQWDQGFEMSMPVMAIMMVMMVMVTWWWRLALEVILVMVLIMMMVIGYGDAGDEVILVVMEW